LSDRRAELVVQTIIFNMGFAVCVICREQRRGGNESAIYGVPGLENKFCQERKSGLIRDTGVGSADEGEDWDWLVEQFHLKTGEWERWMAKIEFDDNPW
jgi:hypothetical protein